jgi:hypothetical protein
MIQSNVSKFNDPIAKLYYEILFNIYKDLYKIYNESMKYGSNSSRNIVSIIEELHSNDYFIEDFIKLRNFLLNSSITFTKPFLTKIHSKLKSENDFKYSIKYRLKSDFESDIKSISNTYDDKDNSFTYNLLSDSIASEVFKKNNFSDKIKTMTYSSNNITMIQSIQKYDVVLIQKLEEFKAALQQVIANHDSQASLKADFFKKRRKTLAKNINKNFGEEPFLNITSTEDLATLFSLLAQYPDQIQKIERMLRSYKFDIQNLDKESFKDIFDEVKVLTLYK